MIFRPFYYFDRGCAAYLFGCGTLGRCAVVDPRADDVDSYISFSAEKNMRITHVIDTHVHADHRSGGPELARQLDAPYCLHVLGIGTAMVYPTLLAAIGDVASPAWRASAIGVYRFWRDIGYAVGAVIAGVAADLMGLSSAMWIVAGLTFVSGLIVASRMAETIALAGYARAHESHHASGA
jgi:glyoxylase-like metal-dependent hydrolase (beta-lactamase superfamily II)